MRRRKVLRTQCADFIQKIFLLIGDMINLKLLIGNWKVLILNLVKSLVISGIYIKQAKQCKISHFVNEIVGIQKLLCMGINAEHVISVLKNFG